MNFNKNRLEYISSNIDSRYPVDLNGLTSLQIEEVKAIRKLEIVGRVCYNSEDRITSDINKSKEWLYNRIMKTGHDSVLEHYRIRMIIPRHLVSNDLTRPLFHSASCEKYIDVELTRSLTCEEDGAFDQIELRGNIRAFRNLIKSVHNHLMVYSVSNEGIYGERTAFRWMCMFLLKAYPFFFSDIFAEKDHIDSHGYLVSYTNILKITEMEQQYPDWSNSAPAFIGEANDYHTVRIVTDRCVSHEGVRHRIMSFTQTSQRYCDLMKTELSVIFPGSYFGWTGFSGLLKTVTWGIAMYMAAGCYILLRMLGCPPQEARTVLPNSTQTDLIVTGTIPMWDWFFTLRDANGVYPPMRDVAKTLHSWGDHDDMTVDTHPCLTEKTFSKLQAIH